MRILYHVEVKSVPFEHDRTGIPGNGGRRIGTIIGNHDDPISRTRPVKLLQARNCLADPGCFVMRGDNDVKENLSRSARR